MLPPFTGRDLSRVEIAALPGLTNRSFLVRDGTERSVLRLAGAGSDAYIDRAAEAEAMAAAARLGLAPPLLAALPEQGLLLTRFLPGARALGDADLRDPALRAETARLLARLHRSGLRLRHRRDLAATLETYRRLAAERSGPEHPALTAACMAAAPLLDALQHDRPPDMPSHIDPVPANFLLVPHSDSLPPCGGGLGWGVAPDSQAGPAQRHPPPQPSPARGEGGVPRASLGRLYLIDWEYASMCEPAWDLADLAGEVGLDAAARADLVAAYGATPQLAARVALLLPLLHLLAAAWAALQLASGNPQGDFAALMAARLDAFYAATP
jgi:thiamine kinase-like enzyme